MTNATTQSEKVKVLYIAGSGRCGSTVLSQLLGGLNGFVNIGESRYLFTQKMRERRLPCSCGSIPGECQFWGPLVRHIQMPEIVWASRWLKAKYFPFLRFMWRNGITRPSGASVFLSSLERIYQEVVSRTGASVIVDTSKHPAYGLALINLNTVDVYVLHLIRDARTVVSSWQRQKGYLKAHPSLKTSLQWMIYNLWSEFMVKERERYMRLRWEDVVRNPVKALETIGKFVGRPCDLGEITVPTEAGRAFSTGEQHALAGNPGKLTQRKCITLSPSQQWELTTLNKLLVSTVTWPLLCRYDYAKIV